MADETPANQQTTVQQENTNSKQMDFYDKSLLVVLIAVAILQFYLFAQLQHIASPVFGGDMYRERGFVQYLLNGNNYWTDPYFKNELEFYPPLGYLTAKWAVQITGLSIDTIISFSPIIITPLIALAFYTLGKNIFKRKKWAFLLAMSGLAHNLFVVKYTYGVAVAFAIFFLAYFFKLEYDTSLKTKLLAGIFLGLSALSHYQPFLFTSVMAGTAIILETSHKIKTEKKFIRTIINTTKKYLLTFFVTFAIAMIFFTPLIIKYNMKTPNRTQEYSLFDVDKHGIEWVTGVVYNQFIQTNSIQNFLFGLLGLAGILACALNFNKTEQRFTLALLAGMTISGGHYLITKPLFNAWVVPAHMFAGLFIPFTILTVWGAKFIEANLEKYKQGMGKFVLMGIILFVIIPLLTSQLSSYNQDKWVQYGRQMDAGTKAMYDIGEWALQNTNRDDVFLANDESAFAINAMTGRHVVAVRRTHASPYVNVDKRYADAMVMIYGNNTKIVKDLLKKYAVKYVYIDQFLASYPMITSKEHTKYLEDNGIKHTIQKVRLDPAGEDTPTYESSVVMPQQITIINTSTPIRQFNADGQPFSIMYKINEEQK